MAAVVAPSVREMAEATGRRSVVPMRYGLAPRRSPRLRCSHCGLSCRRTEEWRAPDVANEGLLIVVLATATALVVAVRLTAQSVQHFPLESSEGLRLFNTAAVATVHDGRRAVRVSMSEAALAGLANMTPAARAKFIASGATNDYLAVIPGSMLAMARSRQKSRVHRSSDIRNTCGEKLPSSQHSQRLPRLCGYSFGSGELRRETH